MPFLQSGIIIIFPTIRYHHSTHSNLFHFHSHISNHHIKISMLTSFQLPSSSSSLSSSSPSFPGKSVSSPPRGFSPSCLDSQPASRKRHHNHYDQMYFDDHCVLSCLFFDADGFITITNARIVYLDKGAWTGKPCLVSLKLLNNFYNFYITIIITTIIHCNQSSRTLSQMFERGKNQSYLAPTAPPSQEAGRNSDMV